MELTKDLLRHIENVLRKNCNPVTIELLSALYEVIGLHTWEFLSEALAIEVFLLIASGMIVETVRNMDTFEAVILAISEAGLVLLVATEEAELILLINETPKVLIQVRKSLGIESCLICHYFL